MKIKTVITNLLDAKEFDEVVNAYMADGYLLTKRECHTVDLRYAKHTSDGDVFTEHVLYAEMVLPDPAPDPEPVAADPWDLVRQLKDFCDSVPKIDCVNRDCPLHPLCETMTTGKRIAIDEWEV